MRKITNDEIRFFDDNGYVICKGVLHADELAHVQGESARLIDEVLEGGPADKKCGRGPEGGRSKAGKLLTSPALPREPLSCRIAPAARNGPKIRSNFAWFPVSFFRKPSPCSPRRRDSPYAGVTVRSA